MGLNSYMEMMKMSNGVPFKAPKNNLEAGYEALLQDYKQLTQDFQRSYDDRNAMLQFLVMQAGIMYTTITGDKTNTDPLKPISVIITIKPEHEALQLARTHLLFFINLIVQGDPASQALSQWINKNLERGI